MGIVSPRNFGVQVRDILWKRHQGQLRPRFTPSPQCLELVREPHIPEPTEEFIPVMAEVPVITPAPAASKETISVLDTPAVNSKPDATLASQNLFMQDSKPQTYNYIPEKPERRCALRERNTQYYFTHAQ